MRRMGEFGRIIGATRPARGVRIAAVVVSVVAVVALAWPARTLPSRAHGESLVPSPASDRQNEQPRQQTIASIQRCQSAPAISLAAPSWPDSLIEANGIAQFDRSHVELCQALAPAQPEPVTGRPVAPIY
ncbi:MAG TPA: hypothetical protein VKB78_04925, partial [Pirellulales bacterium]|nr:hypothetical protein [Pirellulales bacterium]